MDGRKLIGLRVDGRGIGSAGHGRRMNRRRWRRFGILQAEDEARGKTHVVLPIVAAVVELGQQILSLKEANSNVTGGRDVKSPSTHCCKRILVERRSEES